VSYDTWLFEPYERYYNEMEEKQNREEELLGHIEDMESEEEIEAFLATIGEEDPRRG
jgi:hypothetical protein